MGADAELVQTRESIDAVLAHLDSLPTLPSVIVAVLEAAQRPDATAAQIVAILRNDAPLTARVLAAANSAARGGARIGAVERAAPMLGVRGLTSLALAVGVVDCLGGPRHTNGAERGYSRADLWRHALAVACAARGLAARAPRLGVDPEEAFAAGLLHDMGKLALDRLFPRAYERAVARADHSRGDIADHERAVLGVDHTVAGRRLAERWGLPVELQQAIWLHHVAVDALPAGVIGGPLVVLVTLADTLAREQRLGYSGNHRFIDHSPRLAAGLGLSASDLDAVVSELPRTVADNAALLGLDASAPRRDEFDILARANAELGRVAAELEAENRALAIEARRGRAIELLDKALDEGRDPRALCAALAAATGVMHPSTPAAVFVLRAGGAVDAAALTGGDATPAVRTLTLAGDAAELASPALLASGALRLPASPAAGALWRQLCGRPAGAGLVLLPLVLHGELLGGVLLDAAEPGHPTAPDDDGADAALLRSAVRAVRRSREQAAVWRLSEDLAETNRRLQQMQAELLRSRTLATIAELAAGAGHELNSPLTVISGRAQMLAARIDDPEARRALQSIIDKAHECSGIVSELMDFARPPPITARDVDLNELLRGMRRDWLARSGAPASRLRLELAADGAAPGAVERRCDARVQGDAEQLRAAINEMIENAADAVDAETGEITLRVQPSIDAEMLEVLVIDNGCGMPPAVLQRAFDPFFSHRSAGRRRGLGLPRAYRIVEAHGGRAWVESRAGEGTTAHIVLPRAARPG